MRAPAVSFIRKTAAVVLAALLTFTLVPFANAYGEDSDEGNSEVVASALADQSDASPVSSGELQGISTEQDTEDSPVAPMPASGLAGKPGSFINSVVALDSEPVIGSFTVDGLTYAVIDGPYVELVGVSPSVILSEGSEAGGVEESNENHASEAGVTNLTLPETVSYKGVSHIVSSIGAYAFYLSGVTSVMLPASVNDVDNRAFRSSDVANVGVAEGNPAYSSFDGALYDAERLSLLLIPEGKQGAVLLPKTAEVAEASVFSHCPLVDSISVEKDGAAFASENGLLYTSDLTTLLRVPAGATEITIREGCTTIAAGALEACANLTTINAPASVTSISPDVFHAIPTVSLPATSVILSEVSEAAEAEVPNEGHASEAGTQLFAMVALSSADYDLPEVNSERITVFISDISDGCVWQKESFSIVQNRENRLLDGVAISDSGSFDSASPIRDFDPSRDLQARVYANGGALMYSAMCKWSGDAYWSFTEQGNGSGTLNLYFTVSGAVLDMRMSDGVQRSIKADTSTNSIAGWSTLSPYGPAKDSSGSWYWSGLGLRSIWALWHTSTLSFDDNGGSGGPQGTVTATAGRNLNNVAGSIPRKPGYTFAGYYTDNNIQCYRADGSSALVWPGGPVRGTLYARWTPNSYTVQYRNKADTVTLSTDAGFKYDTARNLAAKPTSGVSAGYTAVGWATSKNQSSATYGFGSSQKNLTTSGTKTLYLAETPNSYTVEYYNKAGTTKLSTDTGFKYDTARALAAKPTSGVTPGYIARGWAISPNQSAKTYDFGSSQKNLVTTGVKRLYLAEEPSFCAVTLDDNKGSGGDGMIYVRFGEAWYRDAVGAGNPISSVTKPTRLGYVFDGYTWNGQENRRIDKNGIIVTGTQSFTSPVTFVAQWQPTISAVVPLDVQAQVDVLGLEAPKEAQGYIESRCGEPLKVARVDLTPLDGAKELFGAGNVADVFLEVLANDGASPNARFSLGASATESDASKLQAFTMASYGTRIPISYRFAMPPEVQTSLVEYADPQPVCSVAYTVALV